jgi:hypothetical protein
MAANDARPSGIISIGETRVQDKIRVHRWMDGFSVTDLTNAGKRGKKCDVLRIARGSYNVEGSPPDGVGWDGYAQALATLKSLGEVRAFLRAMLHDFPKSLTLTEQSARGLDVPPPSSDVINLKKEHADGTRIEIIAEPRDFRVHTSVVHGNPKGRAGAFRQDTSYWSSKPKDAGIFYKWLRSHMQTAAHMTVGELRNTWDKLGVSYQSH